MRSNAGTTRKGIQQIRTLIEKRDMSGALTELRLLRSCVQDNEYILKSELLFLCAKCHYFTGEYTSALDLINEAIELVRPTTAHSLYAEQKLQLGRILNLLGRTTEAVEELTEAYAFFRRVGETSMSLDALATLGLVHQARGDLMKSRAVFEDVREKATRNGLSLDFILASFNLSRVCFLLGDLQCGLGLLNECASLVENESHVARLANLRGMGAVLTLDYEAAKVAIGSGLASYRRVNSGRDVAVCLEYLGLNEYFAGNYEKAKEYYLRVLDMPELTASAVAQTLRMLSDVYIAKGDFTKAMATAVKAEAAIIKINERIELGALYRAYGQIYEHRGESEKSRDYFVKSRDLLRLIGAKHELALSCFTAGQSKVFSESECCEQLQQAKALFTEMNIPKRVTQTLSAIVKLEPPKPKKIHSDKNATDPKIITQNPEMRRILTEAEKLADTDETVLITGETGVGKDLLARYIHCRSPRSSRRFLPVSCPNLPESLLESRLFGYRKGAFSGAIRDEEGLFKAAEGGTLLLNEIGEVPDIIQSKLLDVIETKTMFRLGDSREYRVDVRLLAATNCDLQTQISVGSFRSDLFYRLQDFHLHLPPLRERLDDLPLLVQHFLKQLSFAEYDLRQSTLIVEQCGFARYDWPGNVRELLGVLKKAATLTPPRLLAELAGRLKVRMDQLSMIDSDKAERAKYMDALERCEGNKSAAARELGVPTSTLWNQLKRLGVD